MKMRNTKNAATRVARRATTFDRLRDKTGWTRPGSQNPHKASAESHGKRKKGRR